MSEPSQDSPIERRSSLRESAGAFWRDPRRKTAMRWIGVTIAVIGFWAALGTPVNWIHPGRHGPGSYLIPLGVILMMWGIGKSDAPRN